MKSTSPLVALVFFVAATVASTVSAQGLIVPQVLTQRIDEALLFSNVQPMGSARFMGTGGSMTAIGVDATTLHTNPAGIGWNRNANASLSGGFTRRNIQSQLRGEAGNGTTSAAESSFILPNLGFVWARETGSLEFPTLNYGISFTRLANFNETIAYDGRSSRSIIDAVTEDFIDLENVFDDDAAAFRSALITQIDPTVGPTFIDPFFDTRPVRYDFLSDDPDFNDPDFNGYYSEFEFEENNDAPIRRSGRVERTGGINEVALGIGGNYNNTLLWGLSVGIPFMDYTETKVYDEVDDDNLILEYESAGFDEVSTLNGSGVNFKFGAIYLPSIASRISLSFQSPTFWSFDETYLTDFEYNYAVNGEALGGNAQSPIRDRLTNIRTPWRINLGGGYLLGRTGFISTDIEYVNYAGIEFGFDDFAGLEEGTNGDIDFVLGGSANIKVGGELNFDPLLVRLGVGYRTNPIKELRFEEDGAALTYSGGLGINLGKIFIDVAARYEGRSTYFAPYRTFNFVPNVVDTDLSRITGILTVGYRGF